MKTAIFAIVAVVGCFPISAFAQVSGVSLAADYGESSEIIITALKKKQTLQSAAVGLDVFSELELKNIGIVTANELNRIAPSLTVTNGGGSNTSIFVRGVGNTTNNNYLDPAVTPTYDGVVQGRSTGAFSASFFDLERVEVLKGPQGTLYGRNATGGVINVIPRKPKIGINDGSYELSLGSYDYLASQGHINLAVSDTAAFRMAASKQERSGFNRDGTDDLDRVALRAQYLYEPSSLISVRVGADYTHVGGVGAGPSYLGHFSGANFAFIPANFDAFEGLNTSAANVYRQSSVRPSPAFYNLNAMNKSPQIAFNYFGVNADLKIQTDIGEIAFIPAYRDSNGQSYFYGPALNTAYQNEKNSQKSAEIRISDRNSRFDYIIGAFFISESIKSSSQFNQEAVLPIQNYRTGGDSFAFFGNLGLKLHKKVKVNFGGRYTEDSKFMDGLINNFASFCGGIPPVSPPAAFAIGCNSSGGLPHWPNFSNASDAFNWLVDNRWIAPSSNLQPKAQIFPLLNGVGVVQKSHHVVNSSGRYNRFTWRAGVEFQMTDDTLIYASIEDGYRAGGFQLVEGDTSYGPEFITSYSAGMKSTFFNGKLYLNVDAFAWDYRDQQIGYFSVDFNSGILVNKTTNAGSAKIRGVEFDLSAKLLDETRIFFEMQYLDTLYSKLNFMTAPPRNNINCPSSPLLGSNGQRVTVSGQGGLTFDCSGRPLLFSPKWSSNLSLQHSISLGRMQLMATARTSWRSSQYGALEYLSFQKIEPYWTSDASLAIKPAESSLNLSIFVNNLENKRRVARPLASPLGFATVIYTAPRLYGLRLGASF